MAKESNLNCYKEEKKNWSVLLTRKKDTKWIGSIRKEIQKWLGKETEMRKGERVRMQKKSSIKENKWKSNCNW